MRSSLAAPLFIAGVVTVSCRLSACAVTVEDGSGDIWRLGSGMEADTGRTVSREDLGRFLSQVRLEGIMPSSLQLLAIETPGHPCSGVSPALSAPTFNEECLYPFLPGHFTSVLGRPECSVYNYPKPVDRARQRPYLVSV
ncbi:hypothetical protein QBC39DRAFT_100887 [Podospora conica]|nr:hypothetical protein QBC39DRAFT_100887 [Schizothecium conicum]